MSTKHCSQLCVVLSQFGSLFPWGKELCLEMKENKYISLLEF